MKDILHKLSATPEGKKKLLSIYYSLDYIDASYLKSYLLNSYDNISDIQLSVTQKLNYAGRLVNIFSFETFKNVYLNKDAITTYTKVTRKNDNKSVEWHLKQISKDLKNYKYGIIIGPPYSDFMWVTSTDVGDIFPEKLGLDNLARRDVVAFIFPNSEYEIYYPTVMEGYAENKKNETGWHYGNPVKTEKYGKTIDIEKVSSSCTESDLCGVPEYLMKKIEFTEDVLIKYLDKDTNNESYYNDKYKLFLERMALFYDPKILDEIYKKVT